MNGADSASSDKDGARKKKNLHTTVADLEPPCNLQYMLALLFML